MPVARNPWTTRLVRAGFAVIIFGGVAILANQSNRLRGSVASEESVTVLTEAGCSAADNALLSSMGGGHSDTSFPKQASDCAKYSLWSGFDVPGTTSCIEDSLHLSATCATCFAEDAEFAYNNCKMQCMTSWCHKGCLDCIQPNRPSVRSCVGGDFPLGTVC